MYVEKESAQQTHNVTKSPSKKFSGDDRVHSPSSSSDFLRQFKGLEKARQLDILTRLLADDDADKLSQISDALRVDKAKLEALNPAEKAQYLLRALEDERTSRRKKEKQFLALLEEERRARAEAEGNMKALADKIDALTEGLGMSGRKDFLKKTTDTL
jgi:hypothetical protein